MNAYRRLPPRVLRSVQRYLDEVVHGPDAAFPLSWSDAQQHAFLAFFSAKSYGAAGRLWPVRRAKFSERVVEYPFVIARLGPARRILDLGSSDSLLPVLMAGVGHCVVALDLRPYAFRHGGVSVVTADASLLPFGSSSFDIVTAMSTLEHIGVGGYGHRRDERALDRARGEIRRVLAPGGRLLFSVPYGRGDDSPHNRGFQRVFDRATLAHLLTGFATRERRYSCYSSGAW